MSDTTNSPDHVTIIKEGNSGGGIFLGILAAVVLALVAFWALSGTKSNDSADASIRAAADKVGAAADKVGDAAQDAAKNN
ncbi:MAG: hypothetical protein ACKOPQ_00050 [Novosphingobium sp.]|jgi:hypothetical protein